MSLPADARAAGLARTVVRRRLQSWDLDDLLDTAVLLTSEVVTNVIVHTASAPTLGLTRDGAGVRVTVVDGSPVPGLLVNGVDVAAYVDGELDRRFPGRAQRRAGDPDGLRAAWAALERTWAATPERAAAMPAGTVEVSVAGEWFRADRCGT